MCCCFFLNELYKCQASNNALTMFPRPFYHMAPVSLISQRPLSSEHDLSRQPNMLAYGRFLKKSLKIHFLFKRKAHPPRRTLSLALSLEPSCLIDF